mgnify:CR=1 FL=1
MARINFNPEQVRPFSGSTPTLPAGEYNVEIVGETESEKNGSKTLVLDYQVIDGEYKGFRVRDFVHLWHANPEAVAVAQSKLVAIAKNVGVPNFMDTRDLWRKPFAVRLSIRRHNDSDVNQIDDYAPAKLATDPHAPSRPAEPYAAPQPVAAPNQPYWQ